MFIFTFDSIFLILSGRQGPSFQFSHWFPSLGKCHGHGMEESSNFGISAEIFSAFPQLFFKRFLNWIAEKREW